jgi:hypothetical protein
MLLGTSVVFGIGSELPVRVLECFSAHGSGFTRVSVCRRTGCLRAAGSGLDTSDLEGDAGVVRVEESKVYIIDLIV